jgi:hypothetical protein
VKSAPDGAVIAKSDSTVEAGESHLLQNGFSRRRDDTILEAGRSKTCCIAAFILFVAVTRPLVAAT